MHVASVNSTTITLVLRAGIRPFVAMLVHFTAVANARCVDISAMLTARVRQTARLVAIANLLSARHSSVTTFALFARLARIGILEHLAVIVNLAEQQAI